MRSKLLCLLLLASLPTVALMINAIEKGEDLAENNAIEDVRQYARLMSLEQARLIKSGRDLLLALSYSDDITRPDCAAFLQRLSRRFPQYVNFGVVNRGGHVTCSAKPMPASVDLSDRPYFRRAIASGHFTVSNFLIGRIVDKPILVIALPTRDDSSTTGSILFAAIDLSWLNRDEMADLPPLPAGSTLTKIDNHGVIFARKPDDWSLIGKHYRHADIVDTVIRQHGGVVHNGGRLYAFSPIRVRDRATAGYVVLDSPAGSGLSGIRQISPAGIATAITTALLAVLLAWWIGDRLHLRGIRRLQMAADRLRRGDYSTRIGHFDGDGELRRLAMTIDRLANTLQRHDTDLRASERRYRQLIENSNEMILVLQDNRIKYANNRATEIFDYSVEELYEISGDDLLLPEDRDGLYDRYYRRLRGEPTPAVYTIRVLTRAKEIRWLQVNATTIEWEGAQAILAFYTDITKQVQAEEQLGYLAQHDPVTGLANRSSFMERGERALHRARRQDGCVALLYADLDRFQIINDTLGHNAGDAALREAGRRLAESVRTGDVVARINGDEFAILLDDLSSPDDVAFVVQKLLDALVAPYVLEGQTIVMPASIGVSVFPTDGSNTVELLRHATHATEVAKERGRNTWAFFTPDMDQRASERLELEAGLRQALANNEFLIYYQPRVELDSGRISGIEALLRWQHPTLGLVPPDRFIPLLEELGLIRDVGDWVLATACEQLTHWHREGESSFRLAINLSGLQLQDDRLTGQIADHIRRCGIDPSQLELEITESILLHDLNDTSRRLQQLTAIGVHIAVDDFGTGYSALSYLQKLPIDILKVDKSFVTDIDTNPDSFEIARAIASLANALGMTLIAEGVERVEQLEKVRQLPCNEIQGYLFGKPMPADEISALLGADTRLVVPFRRR